MKFDKIISYTFHPIIFPFIGTILYFILLPRHIGTEVKNSIIFSTLISTYIFPLIFIFLLKVLKLIDSYEMKTIEERKFPLLFFTLASYILGILLYRSNIVNELAIYYFGITITLLIAYLLLYRNFKISLHTIGIGSLIGFLMVLSNYYQLNLIIILSVLFVLAGIIATSRLKIKAHQSKEVFSGFILAVLSQVIVSFIYNM